MTDNRNIIVVKDEDKFLYASPQNVFHITGKAASFDYYR
jgi:hypothetical protein